jgi:ribosomal protein L3 glutamine methyltransferase
MTVPQELETVRDWLRWAVTRFGEAKLAFGHGTTNAYDEAAYLLLHALHLPLDRLEPFLDARLTQAERSHVAALFARRIDERVPAAYITGEAWLGEFRFHVDKRVIVPRSFIAELLPDGLAPYVGDGAAIHEALDLCTGSGCLAILLARAFPKAQLDAADISASALAVARINVKRYGLGARIRLIESNLFSALGAKRYDLIVSNPPYVTGGGMRRLPREYRHEPRIALAGGRDGLAVVRKILRAAAAHLAPRGLLVVEVGAGRRRVERAFPYIEFVWPETRAGHPVFIATREQLLRWKTRKSSATKDTKDTKSKQ